MKERRKSERCCLCGEPASEEKRIFSYDDGVYYFYCDEHHKVVHDRIHEPENWRERVLKMQAYRQRIHNLAT